MKRSVFALAAAFFLLAAAVWFTNPIFNPRVAQSIRICLEQGLQCFFGYGSQNLRNNIIVEGDSITIGYRTSTDYVTTARDGLLRESYRLVKFGAVGRTCAEENEDWSSIVAPNIVVGANNIEFIFLGTNDIYRNGASAETIWACLRAIVAKAIAGGVQRPILATMLPRGGLVTVGDTVTGSNQLTALASTTGIQDKMEIVKAGVPAGTIVTAHQGNGATMSQAAIGDDRAGTVTIDGENVRAALNALIRSGAEVTGASLCDFAADPNMGQAGQYKSRFYVDDTHPNQLGQEVLAHSFAGCVNRMLH